MILSESFSVVSKPGRPSSVGEGEVASMKEAAHLYHALFMMFSLLVFMPA